MLGSFILSNMSLISNSFIERRNCKPEIYRLVSYNSERWYNVSWKIKLQYISFVRILTELFGWFISDRTSDMISIKDANPWHISVPNVNTIKLPLTLMQQDVMHWNNTEQLYMTFHFLCSAVKKEFNFPEQLCVWQLM